MRDRFFVDTNVLVYANDRSSPRKKERAREIISEAFSTRCGCVSTQVLQEFFVVAVRKAGIPHANARSQVAELSRLQTVLIDSDLVLGAIDLHLLHQLSFWDALIIKSASAGGCRTLYTEDMNHGQLIDGVHLTNPFRDLS